MTALALVYEDARHLTPVFATPHGSYLQKRIERPTGS
jgi:hypothetical protein